jgi:hypothetical protein
MRSQTLATSVLALSAAGALGACAYPERPVPVSTAPRTVIISPAPTERVVRYPEGRYELYGDGTVASPYYWVWIPAGAAPPNPPPAPRRPQTQ